MNRLKTVSSSNRSSIVHNEFIPFTFTSAQDERCPDQLAIYPEPDFSQTMGERQDKPIVIPGSNPLCRGQRIHRDGAAFQSPRHSPEKQIFHPTAGPRLDGDQIFEFDTSSSMVVEKFYPRDFIPDFVRRIRNKLEEKASPPAVLQVSFVDRADDIFLPNFENYFSLMGFDPGSYCF